MMKGALQKHTTVSKNHESKILERMQRNQSDMWDVSARNSDGNLQLNGDHDSYEDMPKKRVKKRIQQLSDSDSDMEVQQNENVKSGSEKNTKTFQSSDSDSGRAIFKSISQKSRIRKVNNESSSDSNSSNSDKVLEKSGSKEMSKIPPFSDSDSETTISKSIPLIPKVKSISSSDSDQAGKNEQQQTRTINKWIKMKDKFKSLKTSREKIALDEIESNKRANNSSDDSDYEANSIEKIKQKIRERMSFKPSICDPDTSDQETENQQQKSMPKQKKERRIKLTSPKPQRMSAKQAMENMQKIKSESNRMLREKKVSLPYHRPKALSLKDIMSRRKPAVSSDGKSLPIKMNGEQLKQYAQMLEERHKQMMELWQSDTDEENDDNTPDDKITDGIKSNDETESGVTIDSEEPKQVLDTSKNEKEVNADISVEDSDKLFDILSQNIVNEATIKKSKENVSNHEVESTNKDEVTEEQDSETNMKLVFNDSETSITEDKTADTFNVIVENSIQNNEASTVTNTTIEANAVSDKNNEHEDSKSAKTDTEVDSQMISLHYDTGKLDSETLHTEELLPKVVTDLESATSKMPGSEIENIDREIEAMEVDAFSDDDMNIEDIDNIIENAEFIRDIENKVNSQVLIRDRPLNTKPTLTGSPGMVIDLDDSNTVPKKSGVELLKERFTFFAKLKTPDELERDKERRIKPGNQHLKLKQELEEQMAVQRSLEWGKRLEDEKQHQKELKELRGEESDDENDIDKIEAMLGENEGSLVFSENEGEQSEYEEEELLENDIEMIDKPRVKNPMLENEAEESDCEEVKEDGNEEVEQNNENQPDGELNDGDGEKEGDENDEDDEDDESSDSESSESEEEQPTATKKGRILKAFEDSDDEEIDVKVTEKEVGETKSVASVDLLGSQPISQDDVLTLAQRHKSGSEDLFTSQGSSLLASEKEAKLESRAVQESSANDVDLGTQTFSILDSTNYVSEELMNYSDKLSGICETQPYDDNLDAVAAMCSGSFSQSLPPLPVTQISQSQPMGEDILALCTGKFYDNEFISQVDNDNQMTLGASQEYDSDNDSQTVDKVKEAQGNNDDCKETVNEQKVKEIELNNTDFSKAHERKKVLDDNLKSILDELDDPEFDTPKPNKFFCGAKTKKGTGDLLKDREESQVKKKFTIDSDDDEINDVTVSETKKKKKLKKRREKRALQISDDEEEIEQEEEEEEFESEIEEDKSERLVEYDSEENEIEVKPQKQKPLKKKRKASEFFEQEAELTSEDEWVGSGDEDEAGLDRMEREAGDDESFNQGRLQRELGQIHMRDVLDQDKREVRIIQELLFEDGDLGSGGRQRKFKWRNLDGDEETGIGGDELGDTQEETFESEEQWRKQRHERETFLRLMQNNGEPDDSLNVSINRTTIIKANLMSKTMSMLLEENQPIAEKTASPVLERTIAAVTSPKKPFSLLQQSYQGSILSRGKGALARLAALATPLAVDDDAPKGKSAASSSGRNFVFAALTPEAPKVTKRKAETNPSTPKLVKKMKTEEKQTISKSSLLDRMKV